MKDCFNIIFHFNEHDNLWHCVNRDDYRKYWNSKKDIKVGVGKFPELALKNYNNA